MAELSASELNEAIEKLSDLTQTAKEARECIDQKVKRIEKVADALAKATDQVEKVAKYIAVL